MNAEPGKSNIIEMFPFGGARVAAVAAIALAAVFARSISLAATNDARCNTEESSTVARIWVESGAARELYDAAHRDKDEAERRYSLDQVQSLIATGDDAGARIMLDSRRDLLDRASAKINRAQAIADKIRTDFSSLSMGCRQAMVASSSR